MMRPIFLCLFLFMAQIGHANDRVALVVGMADYETVAALDNTLNDAIGVSETLASIGFEVTTLLDASGEEFRTGVDEFSFRAETADLALIYFAGHGVEVQPTACMVA